MKIIKINTLLITLKYVLLTILVALACSLSLTTFSVNTVYAAATGGVEYRYGFVITRGMYLGPNGQPIYAEIGTDGNVIADIGEAIGPLQNASVMDAIRYNQIVSNFVNFNTQNPDLVLNAKLYTREQYLAKTFPDITVTIPQTSQTSPTTKIAVVPKGTLETQTKSIYVRDLSNYDPDLLPRAKGNIIYEAPIDLSQTTVLDAGIRSVLLNSEGQIIQTSVNNIGFKTHFFETFDATFAKRKALGPVQGAIVDAGIYTFNEGITNAEGRYGFNVIIPPCPNFSFRHDFRIWAKVNYKNFDPEATDPIGYYYFSTPDSYFCNGYGRDIPGPVGDAVRRIVNNGFSGSLGGSKNLYVDVQVLLGEGSLQNPNNQVIINGPTKYSYSAPPLNKIKPDWLDLNKDRITDVVSAPDANGYVKVWLDGNTKNPDGSDRAPDLIRLADTAPGFTDQGLLQSISDADLKQTDIYVYRVSDGSLVTKKEGIKDRDLRSTKNGFFYRMWIPGPLAFSYFGGRDESSVYRDVVNTNPNLFGPRKDGLRAGEQLKLIAINRVTGYMGSIVTTIKSPNQIEGNYLNFPIGDLALTPPNLKVKVDRVYTVAAGLSKGDKKQFDIGFEGSALTSDTIISIHTEWLDHDGTPLPEDLEGFTGRLAKVTGLNSLQGGEVQPFAINPGIHRNIVKLKGDILGTEHLYVHVFGVKEWDTLGVGAGDGPLQYRPEKYVPIKVPVFDEAATTKLRDLNAYNKQDGLTGVEKVPAVYRWPYRPEMQFSVFDLKQGSNELKIRYTDGLGTIQVVDLNTIDGNRLDDILSTTSSIDLLYSIIESSNVQLDTFGGSRELVFAFGAIEVIATISATGEITFTGLENLNDLSPEDFLSIRLYQNSDSENVLWELLYNYVVLYTPEDNEEKESINYYFVSADDPTVTIDAALLGVEPKNGGKKEINVLNWRIEGDGGVFPARTSSDTGFFRTTMSLPAITGASAIVYGKLEGDVNEAEGKFSEVVVVPGVPGTINVSLSGTASVRDVGQIIATAIIRDRHGNLVSDGTLVRFSVKGQAYVANFSATTTLGVVTATIKGGYYPATNNTLLVEVGAISSETVFSIAPLTTTFISPPITAEIKTQQLLNIAVTDNTGAPVVGVPVDVAVSHGKLSQTSLVTDAQGLLSLNWYTGGVAGTAQLLACTDGIQCISTNIVELTETPPATVAQVVGLTTTSLIVGDETIDGQVQTQRYDGTLITYNYNTSSTVNLTGTANASHVLTLGSLINPNRNALINLPMTKIYRGFSVNDNFDFAAQVTNVSTAYEHSTGVGRSHYFNGQANLSIIADVNYRSPQSGFKISLKASQAGGSLLRYRGNTQGINLELDGRVSYNVITDTGSYTIFSTVLTLNEWHDISGRVSNGLLQLEVDGVRQTDVAITGNLKYTNPTLSIESGTEFWIGENYTGWLSDFKLYNPSSNPLMTFSNATESISVVLDATGQSAVTIASAGILPVKARITDVDILSDTKAIQKIQLVTKQEVSRALNMHAALSATAPNPKQIAEFYSEQTIYNDSAYVAEKFVSLANNTQNYSRMDSLAAVLAALEYIPEGKPLIPHIQSLQTYFNNNNGGSALNAAADIVGTAVKQALNNRSNEISDLRLPLLVLAEMINASPVAAQWVTDSVRSRQDMEAWFRFLSLPAEGWVGFKPPIPEYDTNCADPTIPMIKAGTTLELPVIPCRITGLQAANIIEGLTVNNTDLISNPQLLPIVINDFLTALPTANLITRKYLFASAANPELLSWFDKIGVVRKAHAAIPAVAALLVIIRRIGMKMTVGAVKNLTAFLMDRSNSRVHPITLAAAIGYLETRIPNDQGGGVSCISTKCKPIINTDVIKGIRTLEEKIFLNVAMKGFLNEVIKKDKKGVAKSAQYSCNILNGTHGAIFELMLIAFFQAKYELTGYPKYQLLDLQRRSTVYFNKKNRQGKLEPYTSYRRDTDIVLGVDGNEILIEAKSVQSKNSKQKGSRSAVKSSWKNWNAVKNIPGKKQKTSYHRQMVLDAIASSTNNVIDNKGDPLRQKLATDFSWYIHSWNRKVRKNNKGTRDADPGIALLYAKANQNKRETGPKEKNDFIYIQKLIAELGIGFKKLKVVTQNNIHDNIFTQNIDPQFLEKSIQRPNKLKQLKLDDNDGFDGNSRFYAFSVMDEFSGELKGEISEVIKSQFGFDVEQTIKDVNAQKKYFDTVLEHIQKLKSELLKIEKIPGYGKWAKVIRESIAELQAFEQQIYDKIDEKIIEYRPGVLIEDNCL